MIENIDDTLYLGSCADDKYGIGNLIRGRTYRRIEGGYEMECLDGEWIAVYYLVRLTPGANQSSSTTITWI